MCHIQLNYAFLLFWSIFGKIHRELLFLVKKVPISETNTEILRKFVFPTMFEKGKSWWKIGLFKQLFLIKPVKWININKNCFSPKRETHSSKLCLSVVLKHFLGNSWRTFVFRHKSYYVTNGHWNTQKVCFSYQILKGANPEENLDLFKQLFLIKPVKGDKY